ncbi:MAG: histidinol-phosphate transaminase [Thermoleophilaceae bacterium]|nr:histidinol-phosphate transaminase [Thermoleophilaceae bacterium]
MSIEFTDRLDAIPPYPKAATYEFGGELVKLASNETPWAPHPDVKAAIAGALENLNRYPDPTNTRLRTALAKRYDMAPEAIAVGNGSCEILLAAAQAMLEPGAEIVYAWPSFSMYPHLSGMTGARGVTVPLDSGGFHDLEAMRREVTAATRIVLVCNPNNPTATARPIDDIAAFAADLPPSVLLILDEAYVEFNLTQDQAESVELVRRHPNVVVLRTFSKVYGLCGLRAGYALGSPQFRAGVDRVRQPFSVNMLAEIAATEALAHQDEVETRVERTIAARLAIEEGLDARGLTYSQSQANFSWIDLGDRDEDAIVRSLAEQGVIVRAGKHLGQEGNLRVTYGTEHENARFLEALDQALATC